MNDSINPREYRLLERLYIRKHSRHELRDIIGAENIPMVVLTLRRKGFNIICERKPMLDRDSKTVYVGYYLLPDTEREKVKGVIERDAPLSITGNQVNSCKKTDKSNHHNTSFEGGNNA